MNYRHLSFYVSAYLSRFTHNYLLTMRLLSLSSLCVSCFLVVLIVRKLDAGIVCRVVRRILLLRTILRARYGLRGNLTDLRDICASIFARRVVDLCFGPPVAGMAAIALLFILGGNIEAQPD